MSKEEKKIEVINAVYKVRLHCPKCAHDIRKPLLRTQGVHTVDVKFEKDEVTVKGAIDAKKIHQRLEKWSKKKVEIVSQTKVKEVEKEKEVKMETIKTTTLKVYMHCNKCELDLKRRLLKHKGIYTVKTDFKAQTITVETILEAEKVVTYVTKTFGKHVEIVKKKEEEKKEVKKEKVTIEVKDTEKIVEFKEVKKVEAKTKEGEIPYFVHYVYAPQWFSDENPNACYVM
ncbi:heavy metal-associated isoprenylated plant protein 4 isoform X2 [Solanum dulcamara]|uniref:heavy metal-associated isoprenylated plant protein 4 isoform X2 n=1 Tax=Solanum dulcamara TaxID=45834 RepID=UPI002484E988|nr:heavy metal-associated isoprenylated plant protein 4 isoform X2 [Solanum dulcamara]